MATPEQNKQLARDYFQAFLARDEAWWAKHIAPEFKRHDPGLPFEVVGPGASNSLPTRRTPASPTCACRSRT